MYFSAKLLTVGIVLIAIHANMVGGASAATKPPPANKPSQPAHIQAPPHLHLPPVGNASAKKATATRSTTSSTSQAAKSTARPTAGGELSARRVAIDAAQIQTRI